MKAMGLQQDGKTGVPVWHKSENRKKVPVFREKRDRKGEKSMLSESIKKLVQYGVESGITPECERIYATNLLLDAFGESEYTEPETEYAKINLEETLNELLDEAVKRGIIEDSIVYRDLFDTKLMNCLMPRPAQVQREFWDAYKEDPEKATDYFYKLSQDSNYIRRYRVKKDQKWTVDSEYGKIDITINLSKPEKNPAAIQNVCFVRKMKAMQEESIIRQGRTTGSSRLPSMTVHGASSTLHMFTTMNIVSYLTVSILR